MGMKIITGYTGVQHVKSDDDAALHESLFGSGDFVLQIGEMLRAEIINNNTIRVYSGEVMLQGHHARIIPGDYENLTINNGTQGKKRIDLIIARYTKDTVTGIEDIKLTVLEGQEGAEAVAPEVVSGNLYEGDVNHDMVLYQINLDGLNITGMESLFSVHVSLEFDADIIE